MAGNQRRRNLHQDHSGIMILLAAITGGLVAFKFIPAGVAIWLTVALGGSIWPKPEKVALTGGLPPDHKHLKSAEFMRTFGRQTFKMFKGLTGIGTPDDRDDKGNEPDRWQPGTRLPPVRASWWEGLLAGIIIAGIPYQRFGFIGIPFVIIVANGYAATHRRTRTIIPNDPSPAGLLTKASFPKKKQLAAAIGGGIVAAAAIAYVTMFILKTGIVSTTLMSVPCIFLPTIAVWHKTSLETETAAWKLFGEQRDKWAAIWGAALGGKTPPPVFISEDPHPNAQNAQFTQAVFGMPGGGNLAAYQAAEPKLVPLLQTDIIVIGGSMKEDGEGGYAAGSVSALVLTVTWGAPALGHLPHITPNLDILTRQFAARWSFKQAFAALKLGNPEIAALAPLVTEDETDEETPLWETQWRFPQGTSTETVAAKTDELATKLEVPYLRVGSWWWDETSKNSYVSIVYGTQPPTLQTVPEENIARQLIDQLDWEHHLRKAKLPIPEGPVTVTRPPTRGPQLAIAEFAIPPGQTGLQYVNAAERIAGTVTTQHIHVHTTPEQRIQITWATSNDWGDNPHLRTDLTPAQHLFAVKCAFAKAGTNTKLGQPTIAKIKTLHTPESPNQTWLVRLTFPSGTTYDNIIKQVTPFQETISVPYLQIGRPTDSTDSTLDVVYGHPPETIEWQPRTEPVQTWIKQLLWDKAFRSCALTGKNSTVTPQLIKELPTTTSISTGLFTTPDGLDYTEIRKQSVKIGAATNNAFLQVTVNADDKPNEFRISWSENDPVPSRASIPQFNNNTLALPWNKIPVGETAHGLSYWNPKEVPHALITGTTGSGKDVCTLTIIPTAKGLKLLGDVHNGDLIFGADGHLHPVVGESVVRTPPEAWRVEFDDGTHVVVSGEHEWIVNTRETRILPNNRARKRAVGEASRSVATIRNETFLRLSAMHKHTELTVEAIIGYAATAGVKIGKQDVHSAASILGVPSKKGKVPITQSYDADVFWPVSVAVAFPVAAQSGNPLTQAEWCRFLTENGCPTTKRQFGKAKTKFGWVSTSTKVHVTKPVETAWYEAGALFKGLASRAVGKHQFKDDVPRNQVWTTQQMVDAGVMLGSGHREFGVDIVAPLQFAHNGLLLDPYLVGLWLGDGNTVHSEIATADPETVKYLYDHYDVTLQTLDGLANKYYLKGMRAAFRAAGFPLTPNTKHIPYAYKTASVEQRLALMQGLMDTDGYVNPDGNCELCLSHLPLAEDALWVIRSLGIKASMSTGPAGYRSEDGTYIQCKDRHRIKFSVPTSRYEMFRLPRKLVRQQECVGDPRNNTKYVTAITSTEPVPMKCLIVGSEDHSYVVGDGLTVTHNSVFLQSIIFEALLLGWKLVVIDPTKGCADFKFAEPYSAAFVDELREAGATIERVYQDVIARKKVNTSHGVGSWVDLPKELQPVPMLVIVDEAFSLILPNAAKTDEAKEENEIKDTMLDRFGRIAREARSAGCSLILAAQRADATVMKGEMKNNLGLRVGLSDPGAQAAIAFRSDAEALPKLRRWGKGRGIVDHEGADPQEFQGFYADQADLQTYLEEHLRQDERCLEEPGSAAKAATNQKIAAQIEHQKAPDIPMDW